MNEVRFIDTTIRDGQASLWAMNMRTSHMLPAMPFLDSAGFDGMEFIATGSKLKKFVRHLKENPWDWIKQGAAAAELTPLRWHGEIDGTSMSGFVPAAVGELVIQKAVDLGIRHTRTGNNWNDYGALSAELQRFDRLGMIAVVNVIYSVSPRHTDEYFVRKTREAAALKPYRLCLKDVGGLLTPERIRTLLPKMMKVSKKIPWEFHGHCNNSLGPLNAIECAKCGVGYLHTAVPPLANGNSQPSIFRLVSNLRELGFDPQIDVEPLRTVSKQFEIIAKREHFPIGYPYEYDEKLYRHQIPGGMMSNLRYQLRLAGVENRLDEVLEETARVRADFGYPIMVTPLAQFVGSQAAINVIVGARYKQVSDQTIEYALGRHGGDEAINAMDSDVRGEILDRARARELESFHEPQPTIADLRARYGHDTTDEDLILRAIVGDDAIDVVKSAKRHSEVRPLSQLIADLTERNTSKFISFQNSELKLGIRMRHRIPETGRTGQ